MINHIVENIDPDQSSFRYNARTELRLAFGPFYAQNVLQYTRQPLIANNRRKCIRRTDAPPLWFQYIENPVVFQQTIQTYFSCPISRWGHSHWCVVWIGLVHLAMENLFSWTVWVDTFVCCLHRQSNKLIVKGVDHSEYGRTIRRQQVCHSIVTDADIQSNFRQFYIFAMIPQCKSKFKWKLWERLL